MISVTAPPIYPIYSSGMKRQTLYTIMTAGGAIGAIAAFLQTLEKLTLLKNQNTILPCDLSSVFSCTTVLNSWQSSVFGFPNSLMCIVLFTTFTATALAGATGGHLSRSLRLGIQAMSLATLGFALWFLEQSIYSIGSLCIFCLFCFLGLLMINWAWLRLNAADLPISKHTTSILTKGIHKGIDTFIWVLLGVIVVFAILLRFY